MRMSFIASTTSYHSWLTEGQTGSPTHALVSCLLPSHHRPLRECKTFLCCPTYEPPWEEKLSVSSHLGNLNDRSLLANKPLAMGCLLPVQGSVSSDGALSSHLTSFLSLLAGGQGSQQCLSMKEKEGTEPNRCPYG